jgi:hypothetical protein
MDDTESIPTLNGIGITESGITAYHGKYNLGLSKMESISGEDGILQTLDILVRAVLWDTYEKFPDMKF